MLKESSLKQRIVFNNEAIKSVSPDFVVKHGTFKGMQCLQNIIDGCTFPKLLGSYERELHPILEKICKANYKEIVNIGCAEGYYAVGLAMRNPAAKVYAYDTDRKAIRQCREMARLNGVDKRIISGSFCGPETLKTIPFTEKGLIFCDCEGFEKELFTKETIPFLSNCDLIIEVHDFVDITISSHIRQLFEQSHDIEVIESVDDIKKAHTYHYKELEQYDLATRRFLLAEYRPCIMEWFYITAKM